MLFVHTFCHNDCYHDGSQANVSNWGAHADAKGAQGGVLWKMCLDKQRQGGKNSEKIYKRKCQPRPLYTEEGVYLVT